MKRTAADYCPKMIKIMLIIRHTIAGLINFVGDDQRTNERRSRPVHSSRRSNHRCGHLEMCDCAAHRYTIMDFIHYANHTQYSIVASYYMTINVKTNKLY
jgi:hypothetical protein